MTNELDMADDWGLDGWRRKKAGSTGRVTIPQIPRVQAEIIESRRKLSSVKAGTRVIVGLKRGGMIEGTLARRLEHSRAVVIELEDGTDVVIIESATSSARVVRPE